MLSGEKEADWPGPNGPDSDMESARKGVTAPKHDRADSDIQITRLSVAGVLATIWGLRRGTESWRRRVCKK